MKAKEIFPKSRHTATQYRLWSAPVRIQQPNYTGYIDVTVTAANQQQARQLMRAQYGVPDWHIGSVKEVK